jgi:hypothetical protein
MSKGLDQAIEALSSGTPPPVGRYRFDGATWAWTDEMFAMHGFVPGEVVPSGELMLSHVDPDEVPGARLAFKKALLGGTPYASYHHLLDARRRRRTVLVTGWGRLDDRGEVVELAGTMVDLTDVVRSDAQVEVEAAIVGVTAHRATIEQAKGMLMLAFGLAPDAAFAVLRAHSQNSNIKVHDLAERLTSGLAQQVGDGVQACAARVRAVLSEAAGTPDPPSATD